MQTIAFGMDKHWDLLNSTGIAYLITYDGAWWRIMWEKECTPMYTIAFGMDKHWDLLSSTE